MTPGAGKSSFRLGCRLEVVRVHVVGIAGALVLGVKKEGHWRRWVHIAF